MRKHITFLFLIVVTSQVYYPQVEDSPLIEIFVLAKSNSGYGSNVTFKLDAVGTAWKAIPRSNPKTFLISEDVNGGIVTASLDASYNNYTGFNYSYTGDHSYPEFGFGFYKLSIPVFNLYFYLDYRDIRYGSYINYCNGHCADIWIKYDFTTSAVYLSTYSPSNNTWGSPISNGDLINIWELKNQGPPNRENVPDFWQNCLVVVNDGNDHPHLVWGTYPAQLDLAGYRIYRRIDGGNFTPIYTTVTETELDYVDNSITLGAGAGTAYYYVTALYSTEEESEATNTVSVLTNQHSSLKTLPELLKNKPIEYSLEQNYPNPFNPSTSIKFTLPQNEFVKIKVFNQMGEEVALLVNGQMSSGTHSIDFDGSELASGIYFYQISAGKFNEVKK